MTPTGRVEKMKKVLFSCADAAAVGGSSRKNHHEQPRRTRVKGREEALHLRKQHLLVHACNSLAVLPILSHVRHVGK